MLAVETYEELETLGPESEIESEPEALALIEKLGLTGQKEMASAKDGTAVRFPYRKATREELFVMRLVCPQHTKLCDYKDGTIPLRVLQVASHASDLFDTLWVLHPKQVIKDPFLIGVKSDYDYSPFVGESFMLARWGAELAPWHELRAKAAAIYRDLYKAALSKVRRELQLVDVDAIPDSVLCAARPDVFPDTMHMATWER